MWWIAKQERIRSTRIVRYMLLAMWGMDPNIRVQLRRAVDFGGGIPWRRSLICSMAALSGSLMGKLRYQFKANKRK